MDTQQLLQQHGIDSAALQQMINASPEFRESYYRSLSNLGLTNLATATGGTALTVPGIENLLILALTNNRDQLKALNTNPRQTVGNLDFSYPIQSRTNTNELWSAFTPETELNDPIDLAVGRTMRNLKFAQSVAKTAMSAAISEAVTLPQGNSDIHSHNIMSAVLDLLTHLEHSFYHGNSDIVSFNSDGIIRQIEKFNVQRLPLNGTRPIYDARGAALVDEDAKKLETVESACLVAWQNNAKPTGLIYPAVLAPQFQRYIQAKMRFGFGTSSTAELNKVAAFYQTNYSFSLDLVGNDNSFAGPCRFLMPKGEVKESGRVTATKPGAPTIRSAALENMANDDVRLFSASDFGDYIYQVFPLSVYGQIGVPSTVTNPVSVVKDRKVKLVIRAGNNPNVETAGYIICRSKKDQKTPLEMTRIKANTASNDTTFFDLNEELPGTASALLVSPQWIRHLFLGLSPSGRMNKLDGVKVGESSLINLELGRLDAALRNMILCFYSPDVMVEYHQVLIKNVGI